MSGPIVRKYGFPNFEKIFGPKRVEHGVEGEPKEGRVEPSPTASRPETEPDGTRTGEGGAESRRTPTG